MRPGTAWRAHLPHERRNGPDVGLGEPDLGTSPRCGRRPPDQEHRACAPRGPERHPESIPGRLDALADGAAQPVTIEREMTRVGSTRRHAAGRLQAARPQMIILTPGREPGPAAGDASQGHGRPARVVEDARDVSGPPTGVGRDSHDFPRRRNVRMVANGGYTVQKLNSVRYKTNRINCGMSGVSRSDVRPPRLCEPPPLPFAGRAPWCGPVRRRRDGRVITGSAAIDEHP